MELLIKLWIVSIWVVAGVGYYKGRKVWFCGNHQGFIDAVGYSIWYVLLSFCVIGSIMIIIRQDIPDFVDKSRAAGKVSKCLRVYENYKRNY